MQASCFVECIKGVETRWPPGWPSTVAAWPPLLPFPYAPVSCATASASSGIVRHKVRASVAMATLELFHAIPSADNCLLGFEVVAPWIQSSCLLRNSSGRRSPAHVKLAAWMAEAELT